MNKPDLILSSITHCTDPEDKMITHLRKCIYFLLLLALCASVGIYSVEAKTSPDSSVEEGNIKSVVHAYFTSRYEARMEKKIDDFSSLIDNTDPKAKSWLQREKDRQEVDNFIADVFKISHLRYEFFLQYDNLEVVGKDAIVELREGNKIFYTDDPENPSQIANLKHLITLKKLGDDWKVVDDLYEDETIKALKSMSKTKIFDNVQKNYHSMINWTPENEPESLVNTSLLSDPAYDGSKALAYTAEWYDDFNTDVFHQEANDCTNFASQAVYAGTNQTMDTSGNYATDWYYDFYTRSGSLPWVQVGPFYMYLQYNPYPGKGPYGYAVANVCSLGGGDIIAMQDSGGWAHTVIVRVGGTCPSSTNMRVDAHSNPAYNRLLSGYSSYSWYGVNITNYRP